MLDVLRKGLATRLKALESKINEVMIALTSRQLTSDITSGKFQVRTLHNTLFAIKASSEIEPEGETSAIETTPETTLMRKLPLPVDDTESDIFVRRSSTEM